MKQEEPQRGAKRGDSWEDKPVGTRFEGVNTAKRGKDGWSVKDYVHIERRDWTARLRPPWYKRLWRWQLEVRGKIWLWWRMP